MQQKKKKNSKTVGQQCELRGFYILNGDLCAFCAAHDSLRFVGFYSTNEKFINLHCLAALVYIRFKWFSVQFTRHATLYSSRFLGM